MYLTCYQAELIVGGYKQYGLDLGKSADQIKAEIEPYTVPPVIISGFADVPNASDDISEAEVKDKFKQVFASLSEADKAVRINLSVCVSMYKYTYKYVCACVHVTIRPYLIK